MDFATVKVPALGLPFRLGSLVNIFNRDLIPGFTLWDQQALKQNICVKPLSRTYGQTFHDDSMQKKTDRLELNGELKIGVVSGLINGGITGKFVRDQVETSSQARVTMTYSCRTRSEQLTMDHLAPSKIKFPEVLKIVHATHVVVQIVYGADAHFLFDSHKNSRENKSELASSLQAFLNFFVLNVPGNVKRELKKSDEKVIDKFSGKFYSDFNLKSNPVSVPAALEVCSTLPALLGLNQEFAVPKEVYLLPLSKIIDGCLAETIHELSDSIVDRSINAFDFLSQHHIMARDIVAKFSLAEKFPAITRKTEKFIEVLDRYRKYIGKKFANVVPEVRKGKIDETVLSDILNEHSTSAFSVSACKAWLNKLLEEIRFVESLGTKLGVSDYCTYADVRETKAAESAVFVIISLADTDEHLRQMEEVLFKKSCEEAGHEKQPVRQSTQLFATTEAAMREKVSAFLQFAASNKLKRKTRIIAVADEPESVTADVRFAMFQNLQLKSIDLPAVISTTHSITPSDIKHNPAQDPSESSALLGGYIAENHRIFFLHFLFGIVGLVALLYGFTHDV